LGRKRRRVIPVIFVPTPPKYFALPRVSIILPTWGDFPQTSQALDMTGPDFPKPTKRMYRNFALRMDKHTANRKPQRNFPKAFRNGGRPAKFRVREGSEYSHRPLGINSKSNLKTHQIPT
jgi:hypothetical protein